MILIRLLGNDATMLTDYEEVRRLVLEFKLEKPFPNSHLARLRDTLENLLEIWEPRQS